MNLRYLPWIVVLGISCSGNLGCSDRGAVREIKSIFNTYHTKTTLGGDLLTDFWFHSPVMVDRNTVTFQAKGPDLTAIYRVVGEKIERLSPPDPRGFGGPTYSYAVIGNTCFYPLGSGNILAKFENGTESPVFRGESGAKPPEEIATFENLTADGDHLAFSTYNGAFGMTGGAYSYRNGKIETVCEKKDLKDPNIKQVVVDGDQVYVGTDQEIVVKVGGTLTKVVQQGDAVPGGKIGRIYGMSGANGVIVFLAQLAGPSPNPTLPFVKRNGKIEVVAEDSSDDKATFPTNWTNICTNGDAVAIIENRTGRKLNLGKFQASASRITDHALVVYQGGKRSIIAQLGDSLAGGVVCRILIGPWSMDSQANIAFQYYLDDGSRGIATATLR